MDASELSESAKARGLPTSSAIVGESPARAHLATPANPDELLDPPRSKERSAILALLARRGLDPDGLTWLLPQLDPLERALAAWDVLTGALLTTDELAAFRDFATDAAAIIGTAGRRGCDAGVVRAIAPRLGDSSRSSAELLEDAAKGRLAAVCELRTRGADLAARARRELPALRDQARHLARAHLPTLASLHLGILWQAFDDQEALLDWIDVLADAGRYDALPALDRLGPQQRAYVDYRSALAAGDPAAAMAAARALRGHDDDVRALAVLVDVGIRTRRTDEAAGRRLAATPDAKGRFAARVDTVARIIAGEPAVAALDRFLGRFGNDGELWRALAAEADRVSGLSAACEAVIARELQWLPHDPSAWQGLALIFGEPLSSAIVREVSERLMAQSAPS